MQVITMGDEPTPDVYKPTPEHACKIVNYAVPLGAGNQMCVHQRVYKTRIEHFSVQQETHDEGSWSAVARIDSTGTVHRHQFDRAGRDLIGHKLIQKIPPRPTGPSVVHDAYPPAYDWIAAHWHDTLSTWAR